MEDEAAEDLPPEIRHKLDLFLATAPQGVKTSDLIRQAMESVFGEEFARSEAVAGLCAFGEEYGPESVVEVLAGAEEELLQATVPVSEVATMCDCPDLKAEWVQES